MVSAADGSVHRMLAVSGAAPDTSGGCGVWVGAVFSQKVDFS